MLMILKRILTLAVLMNIAACAKFLPPESPESLAPAPVFNLVVTADISAVYFSWESSPADAKGRELKSLEGYRLYKKVLKERADLVNTKIPYEIINQFEDKSITELLRLRKEAREAGKISRKVVVDETLKKFSTTDTAVKPGEYYAYKVVPVNQDGVEGRADKVVRVMFRGDTSEIVFINETELAPEEADL